MTTIGRRRQVRIVEAAHERAASPKPPEPVELPPPEAPWLEDPIDRATHAFIAKMSGGFSPMGLTEAWFDWAIHLGVSPARQWQIGSSAVQAAAQLATLASRARLAPRIVIPTRTHCRRIGAFAIPPGSNGRSRCRPKPTLPPKGGGTRRPGMCTVPADITWSSSISSAASSSTSSRPRTSSPAIPRCSGRPSRAVA